VLRQAGVTVQMHAGGPEGQGSMKSQFKKADASGAAYALIFGATELASGQVAIKPLRADPHGATPVQMLWPLLDAALWASRLRARSA
jgi:histidyl-tRNA synthetase